MFQFMIIK